MFSSFSKSAKTHQFRYHRKNTRDPATRYRSIVAESLQENMREALVEVAYHLERLDYAWLWRNRDELRRVNASAQPIELEDVVFRVHGEEGPTVDATVSGHAENLDLEDQSGVDLHGDLAGKLVLEERDVRVDGIPDLLGEAGLVDHGQPTSRDTLDPRQGRGGGLDGRHRLVDLRGAGGDGVGVVDAGDEGEGEGKGGGEDRTHRFSPSDADERSAWTYSKHNVFTAPHTCSLAL